MCVRTSSVVVVVQPPCPPGHVVWQGQCAQEPQVPCDLSVPVWPQLGRSSRGAFRGSGHPVALWQQGCSSSLASTRTSSPTVVQGHGHGAAGPTSWHAGSETFLDVEQTWAPPVGGAAHTRAGHNVWGKRSPCSFPGWLWEAAGGRICPYGQPLPLCLPVSACQEGDLQGQRSQATLVSSPQAAGAARQGLAAQVAETAGAPSDSAPCDRMQE